MSSQDSVLPNLFVIGAPKCGTTTLWELLRAHPDVFMTREKEPGHYAPEFLSATSRYHDRAEYLASFADGASRRYRGEATPWYLYSPGARARLREELPDARFVVMLRNPVEMMHSLYRECLFQGFETISSFERALDAPLSARRVDSRGDFRRMLRYREHARFADHLAPWIDTFGKNRVHVEFLECLSRDPAGAAERLFAFLELPPRTPALTPRNPHKAVRSQTLAAWMRDEGSLLRRASRVIPAALRRRAAARLWGLNVSDVRGPVPAVVWRSEAESTSSTIAAIQQLVGKAPPWKDRGD